MTWWEVKTDISSGKATDDCDGMQLHFAIVKSRIGNFTKTGGMITIRFNEGIDTAFDLITVAQAAQLILSPDGKTQILTDFETGEVLVDEESQYEDVMLRDYLDKFMIAVNNASNLKERELYVVKARAGFFNDRERTLEDLGKEMGVTRERVRQIEIRALWKLRHDENVSSFRY